MQDSIRLGTCLRIASDATQSNFLGLAWLGKCPKLVLDTIFEEQANKNNEKTNKEPYPEDEKAGTEPYPQGLKNARKRMFFATCLKKTVKNTLRLGWNRNVKNARKREVFDQFLKRERCTKAPKSRLDPHVGSGNAKNEIWEPKSTLKVGAQIPKTRENAWFLQCREKRQMKAS